MNNNDLHKITALQEENAELRERLAEKSKRLSRYIDCVNEIHFKINEFRKSENKDK